MKKLSGKRWTLTQADVETWVGVDTELQAIFPDDPEMYSYRGSFDSAWMFLRMSGAIKDDEIGG